MNKSVIAKLWSKKRMRENKWNVVIAEKKTDTNVRMMKLSNSSPRSLRERELMLLWEW